MQKEVLTRDYYVGMWAKILDSYRNLGHDLVTLLDTIKTTNPIVGEVFDKMYRKNEGRYSSCKPGKIETCYQKMDELLPRKEKVSTKLEVTSFKKETKRLEVIESLRQQRVDYVLAILCFMEKFALLPLSDEMITFSETTLNMHTDEIDILVERNTETRVTLTKVTIPSELCIKYYVSKKAIK